METVLLIASEAREFGGLVRHTGEGVPLPWPVDHAREAVHGGRRWIMVANGPGQALAAKAVSTALERSRPDVVVSTGWCGALDPSIAACAVVDAREHPIVCADRVVDSAAAKAELRRTSGASIVDMESAAVESAACRAGIPYRCIRVVTDTAGETFDIDLNAARRPDGRFDHRRILLQVLRRPWTRIPELARLATRSHQAAEKLGDFLAGCRV